MMMDQDHDVASSTQACFGLTLRPGGETMARYLKAMKRETIQSRKSDGIAVTSTTAEILPPWTHK